MKNESKRYLALDVMRGITVAFMIMVNNPGSWQHVYAPLLHAQWHGCTPTDLVFPFFLFAVGVSMCFSFSKYGQGLTANSFFKIGKRTLLIFAIGLFLNTFPQWNTDWSQIRWMGVLQRIALAYAAAALLVLALPRKFLMPLAAIILLLYWALLYFGGGSAPFSLEHNLVVKLDLWLLGPENLYQGFGIPFDPEGILSTMPAIVTVLAGYGAALLIQRIERSKVVLNLSLLGISGIIGGWLWGFFLPINKSLWTSSYVLYSGGWATLFLAFLIVIIDIKEYRNWTSPFVAFGMNPLFIYALAGLLSPILTSIWMVEGADGAVMSAQGWLYQYVLVPMAGNINGSLIYAILFIVLLWGIAWVLHRKKIYIKV